MIIYFAHPINIYNTPKENAISEVIRNKFGDINLVNPNTEHLTQQYKLKGMKAFLDVVDECTHLIIMPFDDGTIGAGVAKEAEHALETGKMVYFINPLTFDIFQIKELLNVLTVDQTREKLKIVPSMPSAS